MELEMTNLQRLKMELKGISLTDDEYKMFLMENNLTPTETYNPISSSNKKALYNSALSALEMIANDVTNMSNYKMENVSNEKFHENLMNRIRYLQEKVRQTKTDEQAWKDTDSFMLFDR